MKTKQVELRKIQLQHDEARDMLTTRAEERRVHKVATTTVNDLSFMTQTCQTKRSAVSASPGAEAKKKRFERHDTGPTSWARGWMMDRQCDARSPGVLDEAERDEIMAENERLEGPWDDFWAAVKKAGWTQPEFIRGKRQVKTLADKPRVELVESTSTTPSTRAGVDDDGSDSD
jgi:hypothetical protein